MNKKEHLVNKTLKETDLSHMTMDEVERKAPIEEPEMQEESLEAVAAREGAYYIKPKRRLSPPLGKLPSKLKTAHKRDWEYVKGIYENFAVPGEALTFSLCLYPGDPDYLWEIPCNVVCYIPRMVAKHLENVQKYHTFNYRQRGGELRADEFTHNFEPTGTTYRGKFRPLEAFR